MKISLYRILDIHGFLSAYLILSKIRYENLLQFVYIPFLFRMQWFALIHFYTTYLLNLHLPTSPIKRANFPQRPFPQSVGLIKKKFEP